MDALLERGISAPPATYEEWLCCFETLRAGIGPEDETASLMAQGRFSGKGFIAERFHQKLADTVTEMLNSRTARFARELNMLISFNELADLAPLFIKLRSEVRGCMFFCDLGFLDPNVRRELEKSVKEQTEAFWNSTVAFLRRQAAECANTDLEDSLFLIGRIQLFA